MSQLIVLVVLVAIVGAALRISARTASTPRCGDCGLRMSAASGTCPACGGRRG